MILYRPVGLQELELIYDSGMKAFPARLPQQPIFYPVLQIEYARQTASSWNAKNGQLAGYVTQFKVEDEYASQFEIHTVGKSEYQELWIPAEEMEEFNKHITGHIKVLEAHFGDAFEGFIPEKFALQGKNAIEQFTLLANSFLYKRMDFYLEIKRNHKAVFLNYLFWQAYEFKNPGLKGKVLQAIKEAWLTSFPKIPLPLPPPGQEGIAPVQQTDSQSSVDSVEEDIAPEEEKDSRPSRRLVEEDVTLVKKPDIQFLNNPVYADSTVVEETDPPFSADPDEDIASIAQARARSFIEPIEEEDDPPAEPINPYTQSLVDVVEEDDAPVEQSNADFEEKPVEEKKPPAEPTASYPQRPTNPFYPKPPVSKQTPARTPYWVKPVQQHTPLPKQIDSHFIQGVQLGLSGKYHEAVEELSKAIDEDPGHVAARTSLGVALRRLGEDEQALACYDAALQLDSHYAEAHYFRANIFYDHGTLRDAIAGYTTAMGLKPELINAHEQAAPQDRLTDYHSTPAEMRWIAKPAYRILDLNTSLAANPRQANLLKERAALYDRLRNYEQAVEDYSSSLALQPRDAGVLHARGIAYEQIGQYERALADFQQAIAINPQLSDAYLHRGVAFGQVGNLRQSIASLTEGIRLAPDNPDGYFNRGTAHFQQGDFERAIDDFSNVIRLSPRDEGAYYWRGISNEEAGRRDQAVADYKQFLELSQDPNARQDVEQKLSQWEQKNQSGISRLISLLKNRQKANQVESMGGDQNLDVYDLIKALGERALNSTWLGSSVDCYGEGAQELFSFIDNNRPITGQDLLRITSGIRKTIEGDFVAFDPGSTSHWILVRAWKGSGFYIETNDPQSKERIETHFQSVEEVEGADAPYEGLFLRTS